MEPTNRLFPLTYCRTILRQFVGWFGGEGVIYNSKYTSYQAHAYSTTNSILLTLCIGALYRNCVQLSHKSSRRPIDPPSYRRRLYTEQTVQLLIIHHLLIGVVVWLSADVRPSMVSSRLLRVR